MSICMYIQWLIHVSDMPYSISVKCVAVSCSVLQCVAVCCSELQCVAVSCGHPTGLAGLQDAAPYVRVAVCCIVCSVLQSCHRSCWFQNVALYMCVVVCCSAWQCVAVCCSVFQSSERSCRPPGRCTVLVWHCVALCLI